MYGKANGVARGLLIVFLPLLVLAPQEMIAKEVQAIIQQARRAAEAGRFADAEKLLRANLPDDQAPTTKAVAIELEILRRIRLDYCLTEAEMLAKLRSTIPDVTTDDLARWRADNSLQYRMIDGQTRYFKREPSNLLSRDFIALQEALDAAVPKELSQGDVPGAVILVGKKNGTTYDTWQKAYGYKQVKPESTVMPADAIFDLASMSKPIATGTSLMILADQGKLDIDDPVAKYLPEFREGDKQQVTIRHLMTHMSGEKPYVGAAEQKQIKAKAGFPCREAIRQYIRQLDLIRPPGTAVQYSCLNAILCAEIVRCISGMEHSQFATQHVFQPLGMKETGFNPHEQFDSRLVPTEKSDYGRGPGQFLLGQVHDPLAAMQAGISGNAGLFSSAADLSRFAQMILEEGELDGVRILQPGTVRRMTRVQNPGGQSTKGYADRRGLLWDIYQPDPGDTGIDAIDAFGHTGYTGTAIRFYPAHGVYVLALTNRVHPDDQARVGSLRSVIWRTVGHVLMGVEP